jgi:opacity protein-like surface antigen
MKRLACAAALAALFAPAMAQSADWTGWYGGAQLGYADVSTTAPGVNGSGGFFGITGGYDYDFGTFVLGGALDYDWASIDLGSGLKLKDVFRAKIRAGYDAGPTLIYITGGYVDAKIDPLGRDDGYYYGVGLDYLVTPQWAIGGEILGHRFKNFKASGVDADVNTIALRAMYRF